MKLINSSIEYVPQFPGLIGMYKHIEKAMRNCYRSEDKIDETSYERMILMAKQKHHYSVLEHGTIYLKVPKTSDTKEIIDFYLINPYSKSVEHTINDIVFYYITTNFRVIIENDRFNDLTYLCEPEQYHIKRYTFKIVCSEAIARELNRHRKYSISQQSTRFCNYNKEKFGSEISFIIPQWICELEKEYNTLSIIDLKERDKRVFCYLDSLQNAEQNYMQMLANIPPAKPEEARGVLPLDTATTVYYTAFEEDWQYIIKMRTAKNAHPDVQIIMKMVSDTLNELCNL